ncbi:MAG: hypothetical protein ACK58M_08210 [Acidobacteriota bacterium]|jgi:hypothetical protein|nr:hypothetical protein [Bryobacteraceae bacterium CoA2 C42]
MLSRRLLCLSIFVRSAGAQFQPPQTPVTFDGTLKAYDRKFVIVETAPDQTVRLEIDRKTKLVDAQGKPLTRPPAEGSQVAIDGRKRLNGVLVALTIKVL